MLHAASRPSNLAPPHVGAALLMGVQGGSQRPAAAGHEKRRKLPDLACPDTSGTAAGCEACSSEDCWLHAQGCRAISLSVRRRGGSGQVRCPEAAAGLARCPLHVVKKHRQTSAQGPAPGARALWHRPSLQAVLSMLPLAAVAENRNSTARRFTPRHSQSRLWHPQSPPAPLSKHSLWLSPHTASWWPWWPSCVRWR